MNEKMGEVNRINVIVTKDLEKARYSEKTYVEELKKAQTKIKSLEKELRKTQDSQSTSSPVSAAKEQHNNMLTPPEGFLIFKMEICGLKISSRIGLG